MPKKQFDLHLHTNYSDGKDTPAVVLKRAKQAGLGLTSITDHNTITHCNEELILADKYRVNFLPGIELSVIYEGVHLHLLGYGFNLKNRELGRVVGAMQKKRRTGIFLIAKKLRALGFDVQDGELKNLPAEYFGLAHIIHILLNKPSEKKRIITEVGSADIFAIIKYYFAQAQEAYVPEDYLPAVKMIKLIKSAGGIISIAHPGSHLRFRQDVLISQLAACGLDALEVFTPKHNWDQIVHYQILAKKLKLGVTVGSNYHEDFQQHDIPVITPIGFMKTPTEVFDNFIHFLYSKTKFRLKY
jgi:predicted metal-dependent phosphoesterase TrpH